MKYVLLFCLGQIEFCVPYPVAEFDTPAECQEAGVQIIEELKETGNAGAVFCMEKGIPL